MASNLPPGVTDDDIERASAPLTGEELYALYRQKHAALGCSTDEWEYLEQIDRDVWDALAADLG